MRPTPVVLVVFLISVLGVSGAQNLYATFYPLSPFNPNNTSLVRITVHGPYNVSMAIVATGLPNNWGWYWAGSDGKGNYLMSVNGSKPGVLSVNPKTGAVKSIASYSVPIRRTFMYPKKNAMIAVASDVFGIGIQVLWIDLPSGKVRPIVKKNNAKGVEVAQALDPTTGYFWAQAPNLTLTAVDLESGKTVVSKVLNVTLQYLAWDAKKNHILAVMDTGFAAYLGYVAKDGSVVRQNLMRFPPIEKIGYVDFSSQTRLILGYDPNGVRYQLATWNVDLGGTNTGYFRTADLMKKYHGYLNEYSFLWI
jgi:hypothetical protein